MPTYDYNCPTCGNTVEIIKPMSKSKRKEKCAVCKVNMVKEVSSPAFHLKGTGWYVTDYKDKKSKKDTKNDPST